MKIKDLPITEKPYEKIENYGAEFLSNAELLSVIIKTGTKDRTAIDIAKEILLMDYENQGLGFLAVSAPTHRGCPCGVQRRGGRVRAHRRRQDLPCRRACLIQ